MKQELKLTQTSSKLDARRQQVAIYLAAQKKKDTIQSMIVAAVVVALCGAILALIAILPSFREVPVIVTYQAPVVKEEVPDRPKDMARGLKPKPASSSSSMARVIAATTAPTCVGGHSTWAISGGRDSRLPRPRQIGRAHV
jgi:hypothetical protein